MYNRAATVESLTTRVRDGLQIHTTVYRAANPTGKPVLCLPGLTRNGRDFHDIAAYLSSAEAPAPRDVYALDYRGRGQSQWDADWKNYTVPTEAQDVLDVLASLNLNHVTVIGTSRGGLISMFMAALQPASLGAVVLNDIGPVIETDGIMRIAGYVGLIPLPRTWSEATKLVKAGNKRDFPDITDEEWAQIARAFFNEKDGRPACGYDPKLKNSLSVLDGPMPTIWAQFEAITRIPLLVLRGENSDILSAKTVREMHARHPNMLSHVVLNEGHAPFLRDRPTQHLIGQFVATPTATHIDGLEGDGGGYTPNPNRVRATPAEQPPTLTRPNTEPANDDRPSVIQTILSGTTPG